MFTRLMKLRDRGLVVGFMSSDPFAGAPEYKMKIAVIRGRLRARRAAPRFRDGEKYIAWRCRRGSSAGGEVCLIADADFEAAGAVAGSRAEIEGAGAILCVLGPDREIKGAREGRVLVER